MNQVIKAQKAKKYKLSENRLINLILDKYLNYISPSSVSQYENLKSAVLNLSNQIGQLRADTSKAYNNINQAAFNQNHYLYELRNKDLDTNLKQKESEIQMSNQELKTLNQITKEVTKLWHTLK